MPEAIIRRPKARISPFKRWKPDASGLFLLYVMAIPLSPQFELAGIPDVRPTDFILLFTLMALIQELLSNMAWKRIWKPPELLYPMLVVIGWDLFRMLVLPNYEFGSHQMVLGVYYILKRVEYVLVFIMAYTVSLKPGRASRAMRGLLVGAIIFCCLIIYEFHAHAGEKDFRASGFGTDQPNQAAIFIVGISILAVVWMVQSGERLYRNVCKVAVAAGAAALLATGSKEGLICGAVAGCILAFWRKRWGMVVGAAVIGILLVPFFPDSVTDRFADIGVETVQTWDGIMDPTLMPEPGSSSLADRVMAAQNAFNYTIPNCLWTGEGLGYFRLGSFDDFYVFEWASNGLIGLLLFFWFVSKLWGQLLQALKSKDELLLTFGQGLVCYLVALLLDGLACEAFYVVRPMELFYLLCGIVTGRATYVAMKARDRSAVDNIGGGGAADDALPTPARRALVRGA